MIYTNLKWCNDSDDNAVGISCKINNLQSFVPKTTENADYIEIMKQVDADEITIAASD